MGHYSSTYFRVFRLRVWGLGFRAWAQGLGLSGAGFRVTGLGIGARAEGVGPTNPKGPSSQ